jgi:hypothetical protein
MLTRPTPLATALAAPPTFSLFQMRLGEIFPALRADRAFVQTLIDTLKVDRPAYRELHAYMASHHWPSWD